MGKRVVVDRADVRFSILYAARKALPNLLGRGDHQPLAERVADEVLAGFDQVSSSLGAAMAKLSTHAKTIERGDGSTIDLTTAVDRKRRIDTAYEIYLGLYQAITGPEDRQKLFREFSPGFFDLIVIDECHRGSAAEDSAWPEILEYFSSATQIGLTATPKETEGNQLRINLKGDGEGIFEISAVAAKQKPARDVLAGGLEQLKLVAGQDLNLRPSRRSGRPTKHVTFGLACPWPLCDQFDCPIHVLGGYSHIPLEHPQSAPAT